MTGGASTPGAMTMAQLLKGVALLKPLPISIADLQVAGLDFDSRRIDKGFVFFAFPGARADGREFARSAMEKGAVAVVSELPAPKGFPGPWIEVGHGRRALSAASRAFYRDPDRRVAFTGVTGTNGKTTTAYLIEAMLRSTGAITGMLGTIEYRLGDTVLSSPNTTPESLEIARFADQLAAIDGKYLVSEVSSHALALGRVSGFHFHTAVFTNLTRDHLDFHDTMDAYRDAKRLLFLPEEGPAPDFRVLNADDPESKAMQPASGADTGTTIWYGLSADAALRAEKIETGFDGLRFDLTWQGQRQSVASPMLGAINVSNLLAAAGAGLSYGMELGAIAEGLASCSSVPGRFERVDCGQPFLVVVDYAHTDDALRNAIKVARGLTEGRVITLFGCGGDRDRTKRPLMGQAAGEGSDYVVLTSDNPRSEDPLNIMNDAMVGLGRFDTPHASEPDRAQAIQVAISQARTGDVVLLAGKGHETYQILKDKTIAFDDRETARVVLRSLGYGSGAAN